MNFSSKCICLPFQNFYDDNIYEINSLLSHWWMGDYWVLSIILEIILDSSHQSDEADMIVQNKCKPALVRALYYSVIITYITHKNCLVHENSSPPLGACIFALHFKQWDHIFEPRMRAEKFVIFSKNSWLKVFPDFGKRG